MDAAPVVDALLSPDRGDDAVSTSTPAPLDVADVTVATDKPTPDAPANDIPAPDVSTPDVSTPDVPMCATGLADCDGDRANGCETDTATSNSHCSACGRELPGLRAARPRCA
ncbi:MAG: hypothetical protein R3A52_01710 [Polyangiales bacterium]